MQKRASGKKVCVIIVTYNSQEVIGDCLRSIPDRLKVYIVDNASEDGTLATVAKIRPDAVIIKNQENIGFGCANNVALKKVTSEFALLLNPDTVLQEDSIKNLLEKAKEYEEAAILAPKLLNSDGSTQHSYKNSVFHRENNKSKHIEADGDLCATCLSGAVMLLRMVCFKKIGFFDPKIFLFYEDDDICLKARNAGHSLVYTPHSVVTHLMGKSSPLRLRNIFLKNKHIMWSRLYLEEKYNSKASARSEAVISLYISGCKALIYSFSFNKKKAVKHLSRAFGAILFLMGKCTV